MVEPDLEQALAELRATWLAAGSALDRCPPGWRETVGEGPGAEAALAALAAHATQTLFRPSAPALTVRPLLPRLSAPEIPPQARGYFRRLLAAKGDEARVRTLIWLAASRGFVAHPADWLPGARDAWAPEVYAPWLAWAVAAAAASGQSDRARTPAPRLRAKPAAGAGAGEAARELAAMVELAKVGLINRHHQLTLKPLKTQAQETRRRELLALVPLSDLAGALGAPEAALVEAVPAGEPISVLRFVEMVAATGPDAARHGLLYRILAKAEAPIGLVLPLAPRLEPRARAAALARVVAREEAAHFPVSLAFAGETLGVVATSALTGSKGHGAFNDLLRVATGDDQAARTRAEAPLKLALANLGVLLAPDAARALIAVCAAAGVSAADPRLDILHLNAALTPERPK